MQLLRIITQFDPQYKEKLEEVLLKASPRLHEIENEFIPHILMGVPLNGFSFDECLKEIIKAMQAVPGFEVERRPLDYDGNEVADQPIQIFSWSSQEIAQDRFGYLVAVGLSR